VLLAATAAVDLLVYGGRHASPPRLPTATGLTTSPVPLPPPPFGIASAEATDVGPYSARITWTTTRPSTGVVRFGPAGMRPLLLAAAPALATQHSVALDGLAANGAYTAVITATSAAGADVATTVDLTAAAAPSAVQATIEDGTIRVDGGAFFPLIAWLQCADRWPASIAEGIDLFGGNQCTGLASLAEGVAGKALAAGTSDDPPVDAPGLLGWFYPDEADARGLTGDSLPAAQPGLRFLTLTQHFFAGAAPLPSGRGMYPGLVAKADVVGFDLYPLQILCRRDFLAADYDAQSALVALAPGKPTFQWIEVREMSCPTVPVTPATIRAESWLAIAGGAHGLGFFPNDWDADTGAVIQGIARRIRQLEPALLEPAVPVSLETSSADVRASARRYHGVLYVIAVNAGTQAAAIRVRVAGGPVELAGSGRSLPVSGGAFSDRLAPLAVRIYVVPPAP